MKWKTLVIAVNGGTMAAYKAAMKNVATGRRCLYLMTKRSDTKRFGHTLMMMTGAETLKKERREMLEKTKEQARLAALNALLNNKARLGSFAEKLEQIYQVLNWEWFPIKRVPNKHDILTEIKKQIKMALVDQFDGWVETGGIRTYILCDESEPDLWEASVQFTCSIKEWEDFTDDQDANAWQ